MNYVPKKLFDRGGQSVMLSALDEAYANRTLFLNTPIVDETATLVNASLQALARESSEDIILYIQSPGGSISAGMSIYDTIKSLNCDVVTVGCGMVASMASFLLCAAGTKGKRYIQPNAEVLIHQPLGGTQGQASDIRIYAEHILRTREKLNGLYAQCTGQSIEKIAADTERDNVMDAQAALSYGLVDKIGDPISEY